MTRLKRRHIIKASFAILILAILLYFMVPRFLMNQKYGAVTDLKTEVVTGDWIWNENELTELGLVPLALVIFKPIVESGVLSFKVFIESSGNGLGVVFYYQNLQDYYFAQVGFTHDSGSVMYLNNGTPLGLVPGNNRQFPIDSVFINQHKMKLTQGEWHDIKFSFRESNDTLSPLVDLYIDDNVIFQNSSLQTPSFLKQKQQIGQLGLINKNYTKIRFKDIKISPIE